MVAGNWDGRTSALQALARTFGVSPSQRHVQTRDFHSRPGEKELAFGATLSIECTLNFPELDGLDEDAAAKIRTGIFQSCGVAYLGETLMVRTRL